MGLVQLSLDNTVVTDAGLRQVAGECVMVSIHMGGADDDAACGCYGAGLKKLQELSLSDTR